MKKNCCSLQLRSGIRFYVASENRCRLSHLCAQSSAARKAWKMASSPSVGKGRLEGL